MEETGFWQKKIIATTAPKTVKTVKIDDKDVTVIDKLFNSFTSSKDYYGDGEDDDFQLGHEVDLNVIRFADVLLMHSEITNTADE